MEKFMLIFHGGMLHDASPEEIQTNMGKWLAWVEKLTKNGQYAGGDPLLPGGKLITGPKSKNITDGPYTEGKEVIGGYFIVEAKDYDSAIALTEDYPDFELGGTIQVRQIMKVDM